MRLAYNTFLVLPIVLFIGCHSNNKQNQPLTAFSHKNGSHYIFSPELNTVSILSGNQMTTYKYHTQAFKNIKRNRAIDVAGKWDKIDQTNFNFTKGVYLFSLENEFGFLQDNEILFYNYDEFQKWQLNEKMTFTVPKNNKGLLPLGHNELGVVISSTKMDYFKYSESSGWKSAKNIDIPNIKDGVIPIPSLFDKKIAVFDKKNKSIEIYKYNIESSFWKIEIARTFQVPEKFDDIIFCEFRDFNSVSQFWSAPNGLAYGVLNNDSIEFYIENLETGEWIHTPQFQLNLFTNNKAQLFIQD